MEIGIGLFFGIIARLIMLGAQSAGSVIALQIGIASALVADPTTQQQAAITGNFLLALTVVLIFATGLDHMTLKGLVGTYAIFPPGEVPPMGDVADHAARIVADSFAVAIAMSAPFLVYGIVFAVMLGLLARLMPTLQVFFIAMPLQLLAGFGADGGGADRHDAVLPVLLRGTDVGVPRRRVSHGGRAGRLPKNRRPDRPAT